MLSKLLKMFYSAYMYHKIRTEVTLFSRFVEMVKCNEKWKKVIQM